MEATCWHATPDNLTLGRNEVHVWRADLRLPQSEIKRLLSILSKDEHRRATSFRTSYHKGRFIAARGTLRRILSLYLCIQPERLLFTYGNHGKPKLATEINKDWLQFNLSHSGDYALYAVTADRRIGVDIEVVSPKRRHNRIPERFFHPQEIRALRALPKSQQLDAFYTCWTRKEAYIKSRGLKLMSELNRFSIPLEPGKQVTVIEVDHNPENIDRWTIMDINPFSGYRAALAVEGEDIDVSFRLWEN